MSTGKIWHFSLVDGTEIIDDTDENYEFFADQILAENMERNGLW